MRITRSDFYFQSKVFAIGISDSLSINRILPLVVNDSAISFITAKILVAFCVLLICFQYLFHRGIVPVANIFQIDISTVIAENNTENFVWYIIGLVPICLQMYRYSMSWYQELADYSYKYVKGSPKDSSLLKSDDPANRGTWIWLFTFLQVQLLTSVVPLLFNSIQPYLDLLCTRFESHYPLFFASSSPFRRLLFTAFWSTSFLLQFCGFAMMCMLYGSYAFDPQWIADGMDPYKRCDLMERHWAYFIGFGFPYVVLVKSTSFFVGFGAFLAVFPLCIMLGSVSDFQLPYKNRLEESRSKKEDEPEDVKKEQQIIILPVFALSKKWTEAVTTKFTKKTKLS
mmetsp:Transcript_1926/g.3059  ORF Transcript_1926/g.3059 Transcript_1926/m.3059 type:complete len:341 (+) Transcript_1926:117-1139(+)